MFYPDSVDQRRGRKHRKPLSATIEYLSTRVYEHSRTNRDMLRGSEIIRTGDIISSQNDHPWAAVYHTLESFVFQVNVTTRGARTTGLETICGPGGNKAMLTPHSAMGFTHAIKLIACFRHAGPLNGWPCLWTLHGLLMAMEEPVRITHRPRDVGVWRFSPWHGGERKAMA